ncbi:unnamed protein product [Pylaiella littoralis]
MYALCAASSSDWLCVCKLLCVCPLRQVRNVYRDPHALFLFLCGVVLLPVSLAPYRVLFLGHDEDEEVEMAWVDTMKSLHVVFGCRWKGVKPREEQLVGLGLGIYTPVKVAGFMQVIPTTRLPLLDIVGNSTVASACVFGRFGSW